MRDRIDEYGWDGEYYLYARTDDDIPLGSHTQDEGKIFLNPQIWAVFASLDKDNRHIKSWIWQRSFCSLMKEYFYPGLHIQDSMITLAPWLKNRWCTG